MIDFIKVASTSISQMDTINLDPFKDYYKYYNSLYLWLFLILFDVILKSYDLMYYFQMSETDLTEIASKTFAALLLRIIEFREHDLYQGDYTGCCICGCLKPAFVTINDCSKSANSKNMAL